MICLIATGGLEQSGSQTREAICKLRHVNVNKQRKLLDYVCFTPPRGAVLIKWHFNILHRKMQAAGNK